MFLCVKLLLSKFLLLLYVDTWFLEELIHHYSQKKLQSHGSKHSLQNFKA